MTDPRPIPTPAEIRARYAAPILDAIARSLGMLDHRTHGAGAAIARHLGVHPRQVSDAIGGRVSVELLLRWASTAGVYHSDIEDEHGGPIDAWTDADLGGAQ